MKNKLNNPLTVYFLKNYLLLLVLPFIFVFTFSSLVTIVGNYFKLWEGEGYLGLLIIGKLGGYITYLFSLLLSFLLIIFLNNKYMSGRFLTTKTKLVLTFMAFLLYLLTLYVLSFFI